MQRLPPTTAQDDAAPPRLLALLRAVAALRSRPFQAVRGDAILRAGGPLTGAFLVAEGMVAASTCRPDGGRGEAGLVGPGRLVGFTAAFGAQRSTVDAEALTSVRGHLVETETLARLVATRPDIAREINHYALWRIAELERLIACASSHSIERRLARWLSSAAAISEGRPIEVTHQQLAQFLGVRRASVTVSLHLLEGEHAVRCRRGRIEIRDRARLDAASCGCHLQMPTKPWGEQAQDA